LGVVNGLDLLHDGFSNGPKIHHLPARERRETSKPIYTYPAFNTAGSGSATGDLEDKYIFARYRVLVSKEQYDRTVAGTGEEQAFVASP
jgi:hypothetical protein